MKQYKIYTWFLCTFIASVFALHAQQNIGYYPNMDGGFQNQQGGNLATARGPLRWSFVSSGNGQVRTIVTTGGYGGNRFLTIGKASTATTGASTTVNSNEVTVNTFLPNTLYIVQFHYKINAQSVGNPDSLSYIFISADGTSGGRITKQIKLSNKTTWTLFTDTIRTNNTSAQQTTGTAGLNIRTSAIGTATLVDVDNFVIYPADNQTSNQADITAPNAVTGLVAAANSPADINLSWNMPSAGIDSGGYVVVRYTAAPASNDNPIQNAIYSIGDTVSGTVNGIVVYTGKQTSILDNFMVTGNTSYYYKVYTVDKAFNYSTASSAQAATASFSYFYYNGTGAIDNVTSWGANSNGTGANPQNFTNSGQYFYLQNTSAVTINSAWQISGSSSKLIVGSNTQPAINVTVTANGSLTGNVEIVAPSTGKHSFTINGGTIPAWTVLGGEIDLTVGTNVNTTIVKAQYGNITVATPASVTVNMSDTLFVNNFTINAGSVFSTTTNQATNNTIRQIVVAPNGSVTINGTFKTGKTAGFINAAGSGAIAFNGASNLTIGSASTIVYDKVAATTTQTISALQYANLEVTGASPKTFETGNLKISGNFIFNNVGNLVTAPTSVEFNGTSAVQLIDSIPAPYFGDVTFNGSALKKLNENITVSGVINFISGKLDVDNDTLFVTPSATIGSGTTSSYIVTGNNAAGKVVLKGVGATSSIQVPIGTNNAYLPITLTPAQSAEFAVSAIDGLTTDGTLGGNQVSALAKQESINAMWQVDRLNGSGNVFFEATWPANIEGATFSALPNSNLKLHHFNSTAWLASTSSQVSNSTNTVSDSIGNFGSFTVSKSFSALPVSSITLTKANAANNKFVCVTQNEKNTSKVEFEKSTNGFEFKTIFSTKANSNSVQKTYEFIDNETIQQTSFYRVAIVSTDGQKTYSNVIAVDASNVKTEFYVVNPITQQSIQIKNINNNDLVIIQLHDANGKLQMSTQQVASEGNINIALTQKLASGVYYLSIVNKGNTITKSIIIK